MKKQILTFLAGGIAFTAFFAFKPNSTIDYTPTNATAEAVKINGFYIYADANPVKKYRLISVITSVELGTKPKESQQYTALRNKFIDKATEQYGNEADGLIFKYCDGCVDKVNVIKFE